MPETIEVCYVDANSVACDGGCGPLGHPKVYMAIDRTGRVTCAYCGRLFVRDPERAGESELMAQEEAAALTTSARRPPSTDRSGQAPEATSALGELEAATRLALAVLLALDDARIAGEEAAGLEHAGADPAPGR